MMEQLAESTPVLVTGASGFVGRVLVENLVKEGVRVRAYVRDPLKVEHFEKMGVEVFRADYSDLTRLEEAALGTRVIYHLGEAPTVSNKLRRYNVELVRRLIGRALHSPRQRLVFVSSLSVCGIPSVTPATEETPPERTLNDPYTLYKRHAEQLIREAFLDDGLDFVIVRPALVYGPGSQHIKGLIRWLEKYGKIGIPFAGKGDNIVPLVHVEDLVRLLICAGRGDKASGKIVNAVDDSRVSAKDFLIRIGQQLGKVVKIRATPKSLVKFFAVPIDAFGDLIGFPFGIGGLVEMISRDAIFSNVRMKSLLDRPLVYPTVTEGLPTLIEWYRREKR